MSEIKILLDNSVIKEDFFKLLDENNILKLVHEKKISFYLPDIIFFENFIPLHVKDYNRLKVLLDNCFKYCKNIFLPLRKIIEQEILNSHCCTNCFYEIDIINEFIKNYSNGNAFWNINKYCNDASNNQQIFDMINKFVDENIIQIFTIKSKTELEGYICEIIQKYNYLNIDKMLLYKNFQKGNSPKENAKEVYGYIAACFLTNIMISNFNTTYSQIKKLFQNDNYFWTYYNTYFCTLISRVFYGNFHKDSNYFDNEYITYMKDLDILVANDSSYMKDCFNEVYKNTSKHLMKPKEFINYLLSLF